LFADIKGSMDLMEDLDPEEARAIIDPALKLMIEAVGRYDGYIVQSTGDGIFALFGAPVAHEDHPQRALYAALRMQEEMRRYSAKLREAGNLPLEARVGVNTGEVVVRSITTGDGHTEYTPIGHTANLASRMQAVAPTGSIAVSENTRRLVEGYFALKPLGPTKVKGVSEPVNVYEVTGLGPLRTRLQRSAERGLTKFVGRERETDALRHALEQAQTGHGQIVAAMAEPGVGKSRLFFEFKATSQSGWMVLETFSVSHGKASAYLPVIDLLRNYFRIAGEDDERTRREKVNGKVLTLDRSLEDAIPYLFSLLGIVEGDDPLAQMDGQIKKRRTLEAIKRILLRESLNQPLMAIFEDLHWIDEATQEFLNLLADSLGTAKILLLVNYRPEYSHKWNSKTYYTQLRLDPLSKESAEEMLAALLGASPAPATGSPGASRERPSADLQVGGRVRAQDSIEALKHLIIDKTEGNPFFMEETVQVLLDEGALVRDGTAVRLTRQLNELKIPPTVQAILAARIDRLPAGDKDLLQTLAVIGKEFPLSLVRAATGKPDDELNRILTELQPAEFIYEQPAVGDVEYIFKHALTQEVAYNSVLIERRRALHERVGATMESLYGSQLDDHLSELARHYSLGANVQKAVDYLQLAGERAAQRSAYAEAISHFTKAVDLLKTLPDAPERIRQELALQIALSSQVWATEGYAAPAVKDIYDRALELCRQIGETSQLFSALFGFCGFYLVKGEQKIALELANQLIGLAQHQTDSLLSVRANYAMGLMSVMLGEFVQAQTHLEQSIALYHPEQHHSHADLYDHDSVASLSHAAWTLWYRGYPDQAVAKANEALLRGRKLSDPFLLALALWWAAVLHQFRREGELAEKLAEAAITLSTERGFPLWLAQGTVTRGWALAERGQCDEGIAQLRQGLAALRATGAEYTRPHALTLLAEAHGKVGKTQQALLVLGQAMAIVDRTGERYYAAEMYRLKGELLLMRNSSSTTDAESCFRTAIEIAREQSAKSLELRATTSLARLLVSQSRRDEARTMLAEIYGRFTEGFDTADLKDARALLTKLSD